MNEQKNKLTEKELKLIEETELFMEEVYNNPDVADAEPPVDLHDKVFAEIRAREAEKQEVELKVEKLTAEEKELIHLGRIYKKRRKLYRVMVVAAVLIMAMAFGITSIGGPEKIFEKLHWMIAGREQVNVDSKHEDVTPTSNMSEDEAYQKIEEEFGFVPVGLGYFPKDVTFLDGTINEETQSTNLVYGKDEIVKLVYFIRPNFRLSSFGKDVEDEFLEEHIEENEYTTIYIRKYLVNNVEERWSVQFEYKEVLYSLSITDTSKEEVEEIVKNLFFS